MRAGSLREIRPTNNFVTSILSDTFVPHEFVAETGGHPDPRKRLGWVGGRSVIATPGEKAFCGGHSTRGISLSHVAATRTARSRSLGDRHELRSAPRQIQLGHRGSSCH